MKSMTMKIVGAAIAGLLGSSVAFAQYPTGDAVNAATEAAKARNAEGNKRSNLAHQKAWETVMEWDKKGKPFIPWASHPMDLLQESIPAFPGAEGGAMYTAGGRGGKVYIVTNLNDHGPGSFREACEAGGPRIIVFNVSGIIKLETPLSIRAPYITINGSTAPGDGVCIAGNSVMLDTHDIVIRYMRFRRGAMDVGDRNDSLGGNPVGNVMIDHVSGSWGLDENMSFYRHMHDVKENMDNPYVASKYKSTMPESKFTTDLKLPTVNVTVQYSIFSEGLNTYHHAFGSTIGGRNSVFHHNIWACNTGRNPSVGMDGDFGFVNNVIFNWVHRTIDGGDYLSNYNIINNYFKPGPATPLDKPIAYRILKPEQRRTKDLPKDYGQAYVHGNVVEGNDEITKDNWAGGVQIDLDKADTRDPKQLLLGIRTEKPFSIAPVTITSAKEAFETNLKNSGATLPRRDAVDERVVKMVRTGQATAKAEENIEDSLSHAGYSKEAIAGQIALVSKGIITNPAQVGGYPEYKGEPYKDTDNDGMSDDWEIKNGLNSADANDTSLDTDGDGYTNIEEFINGTNPKEKIDYRNLRNNLEPRMAN